MIIYSSREEFSEAVKSVIKSNKMTNGQIRRAMGYPKNDSKAWGTTGFYNALMSLVKEGLISVDKDVDVTEIDPQSSKVANVYYLPEELDLTDPLQWLSYTRQNMEKLEQSARNSQTIIANLRKQLVAESQELHMTMLKIKSLHDGGQRATLVKRVPQEDKPHDMEPGAEWFVGWIRDVGKNLFSATGDKGSWVKVMDELRGLCNYFNVSQLWDNGRRPSHWTENEIKTWGIPAMLLIEEKLFKSIPTYKNTEYWKERKDQRVP